MDQCSATKRDGSRCKVMAYANGLCIFHDRRFASAAGRVGGKVLHNHHKQRLPVTTPEVRLRNSADVLRLISKTVNQVRTGQLEPKLASTVGYLCTVALQALHGGASQPAKVEIVITPPSGEVPADPSWVEHERRKIEAERDNKLRLLPKVVDIERN